MKCEESKEQMRRLDVVDGMIRENSRYSLYLQTHSPSNNPYLHWNVVTARMRSIWGPLCRFHNSIEA